MRAGMGSRFRSVFAYTIEMSFGGATVGARAGWHLDPSDYRAVGAATAAALRDMFL
jgi:hypothetical protein